MSMSREEYDIKSKRIEAEFFPKLAALCTEYHVTIGQVAIDVLADGREVHKIEHFGDGEWYMFTKSRPVHHGDGI